MTARPPLFRILRLMSCESIQYGSMERYLVRFARLAGQEGHRVVVVYDAMPSIQAFVRDLESAGGVLVVMGETPAQRLRYLRRCFRLMRALKPDVLHAYFTPGCHIALAAACAARIGVRVRTSANMPLLTHPRQRRESPGFRLRFGVKQTALSLLAQRILALTPAMREEYLSLGVSGGRVTVVSGGVDTDFFRPVDPSAAARFRESLGVEPGSVLIGTLCRLVPVKNLGTWLAAVARVCAADEDVTFVVVGDGPLRGELEEYVRSQRIEHRVRFAGHRTDAPTVLSAMDIVACPSTSEGLSNSVMEAMSMEKVLVASDIPPNRTLIDDGHTGFLFPPSDERAVAHRVLEVLNQRHNWPCIGAMARRRIVDGFSLDARVRGELAVYADLVR